MTNAVPSPRSPPRRISASSAATRCSSRSPARTRETLYRCKLLLILNLWRPARLQTIAFELADEARRQFSQPLDVDSAGTCDVTHCEIYRPLPHIFRKLFLP